MDAARNAALFLTREIYLLRVFLLTSGLASIAQICHACETIPSTSSCDPDSEESCELRLYRHVYTESNCTDEGKTHSIGVNGDCITATTTHTQQAFR